MVHEILAPGVQHGQQADLIRSQMSGIRRDFPQRLAGSLEQHPVEQPLILQGQGRDLGGQRKNDVKVGNRQEFGRSLFEPVGAGQSLALGAMTVAARIVGDLAVPALVTRPDVSTHDRRATGLDIGKHSLLARRKSGAVIPQEGRCLAAKDVGHFQTRSARQRLGCRHQTGMASSGGTSAGPQL